MKLYMHPSSTVCRPILPFAAENDLPLQNAPFQGYVDAMKEQEFAALG